MGKSLVMVDISKFLNDSKSLIVAPAGYGKTHTIVDCLLTYKGNKKILVLTHTHAGIASLRSKIQRYNVPSHKYELDTISGHALELAQTYHMDKNDFPAEDQIGELLEFALKIAEKLYRARPIIEVLKSKYEHLIVDEYQDCTIPQHNMIMSMALSLKTHILGDSMQGIFSFRNSVLVDMDGDAKLMEFRNNTQYLDTPWRWQNAGNFDLGKDLDAIRVKLQNEKDINLADFENVTTVISGVDDYRKSGTMCRNLLFQMAKEDSLLLIHPNSMVKTPRERYISNFRFLRMIESIDDKDYYKFCKECDNRYGESLLMYLLDFCRKVFLKTAVNAWFRDGTVKNKREDRDKLISAKLSRICENLKECKSYALVAELIMCIMRLPNNNTTRSGFINDLITILNDAYRCNDTALNALKRNRDKCRKHGRKVDGRYIGTTLLTKGMEYDTVVVLNAHEFDDPKHLYVALTRCCKNLIVMSEQMLLHPYNNVH